MKIVTEVACRYVANGVADLYWLADQPRWSYGVYAVDGLIFMLQPALQAHSSVFQDALDDNTDDILQTIAECLATVLDSGVPDIDTADTRVRCLVVFDMRTCRKPGEEEEQIDIERVLCLTADGLVDLA